MNVGQSFKYAVAVVATATAIGFGSTQALSARAVTGPCSWSHLDYACTSNTECDAAFPNPGKVCDSGPTGTVECHNGCCVCT